MQRITTIPSPGLLGHGAQRVNGAVRRYGFMGIIRVALERVRERLTKRFHLLETHVVCQIELNDDRPRQPLPEGFRLIRATSEDLGVCETFGWVARSDAERRHRDGATLWLVLDDEDRPVFCCWIFTDQLPVFTAKRALLTLRSGTAAIENSFTAPEHRGCHLGPVCACNVMDRLVEDGFDHLLTKIEEPDERTRKAAVRAGFQEIATMHTSRRFWFEPKVEIRVLDDGEWPFVDQQLGGAARREASTAPLSVPVSIGSPSGTNLSASA
jgi:hypothetical protein